MSGASSRVILIGRQCGQSLTLAILHSPCRTIETTLIRAGCRRLSGRDARRTPRDGRPPQGSNRAIIAKTEGPHHAGLCLGFGVCHACAWLWCL